MELLHDYPNLGEPEPVEEEENGTQVKEVCCYIKKSVSEQMLMCNLVFLGTPKQKEESRRQERS